MEVIIILGVMAIIHGTVITIHGILGMDMVCIMVIIILTCITETVMAIMEMGTDMATTAITVALVINEAVQMVVFQADQEVVAVPVLGQTTAIILALEIATIIIQDLEIQMLDLEIQIPALEILLPIRPTININRSPE